jgi:hypothetical protein
MSISVNRVCHISGIIISKNLHQQLQIQLHQNNHKAVINGNIRQILLLHLTGGYLIE